MWRKWLLCEKSNVNQPINIISANIFSVIIAKRGCIVSCNAITVSGGNLKARLATLLSIETEDGWRGWLSMAQCLEATNAWRLRLKKQRKWLRQWWLSAKHETAAGGAKRRPHRLCEEKASNSPILRIVKLFCYYLCVS